MKRILILAFIILGCSFWTIANPVKSSGNCKSDYQEDAILKKKKKNKKVHRKFGRIGMHHPRRSAKTGN